MRKPSNLLGRCALLLLVSPVLLLAILWPWHPHSPLGWCLVLSAGLPPVIRLVFFTDRTEGFQRTNVDMTISATQRETLASALGGAPGRLKEDLNASLGAVSAFFGFVALLFALPLVAIMAAPFPLAVVLSAVVAALATVSILAARRAPRVTNRHLALAKAGYGASVIALVGCVVMLVVVGSRALV